ncbi:MAG: hypothetical protein AM326_08280 [Candidatus Thorarchaeota archaeon SMTZ-45]|nr:MAG: hypothetical protein AM326_08280 [Candidatus Thorarchaeota archaeon SMTZ-45]
MATKNERKFLAEWFRKRFGRDPKDDKYYFEEWVHRLDTGQIERYMDSQSLNLWTRMKVEKLKRLG